MVPAVADWEIKRLTGHQPCREPHHSIQKRRSRKAINYKSTETEWRGHAAQKKWKNESGGGKRSRVSRQDIPGAKQLHEGGSRDVAVGKIASSRSHPRETPGRRELAVAEIKPPPAASQPPCAKASRTRESHDAPRDDEQGKNYGDGPELRTMPCVSLNSILRFFKRDHLKRLR